MSLRRHRPRWRALGRPRNGIMRTARGEKGNDSAHHDRSEDEARDAEHAPQPRGGACGPHGLVLVRQSARALVGRLQAIPGIRDVREV